MEGGCRVGVIDVAVARLGRGWGCGVDCCGVEGCGEVFKSCEELGLKGGCVGLWVGWVSNIGLSLYLCLWLWMGWVLIDLFEAG